MNPIRFAGQKLGAWDQAYADAIKQQVINSGWSSKLFHTDYGFGMTQPFATLNAINAADMANPSELLVGKLGAAGRYGIPAAGIGGAGIVANSMLNNGNGYEADEVSSVGPIVPGPGDTLLDGSPTPAGMSTQHVKAVKNMLAAGQLSEEQAMEWLRMD